MRKYFISFLFLNTFFSQDYKKQVENNNCFTFELFSKFNVSSDNLFLLPFSVSSALAMRYDGARGKTRKEMSEVLHFPEDAQTINDSFKHIVFDIQKLTNPEFYVLHIANSIWAQKDCNSLHSFSENIHNYYDAKIESVDFIKKDDCEQAGIKINNWTAKKNNNKIKNLSDNHFLDDDTKMLFVNAVYFPAKWDKQFDKKVTKPNFFFDVSGKIKKEDRMKYAERGNIRFLEIPYRNKRASMIVKMPDTSENFKDFKAKINLIFLYKLYKFTDCQNVTLSLLKFKIEYKNNLTKTLYNSGMERAFTNQADFAGMTCKKELQIDKVTHQTFIDFNESGTETAVAAAVVMKCIMSVNPRDLIESNPIGFLSYLIKENTTGSILFIEQLVK